MWFQRTGRKPTRSAPTGGCGRTRDLTNRSYLWRICGPDRGPPDRGGQGQGRRSLKRSLFQEGSQVKTGQLLFVIDQRPYKAALQEARGSLAQAQANLDKARKDVERLHPLVAEDAAPKVDLDNAEAAVQFSRASIEKAKAAIAKTELDLKFTEIRSPINGIIGKQEVTAGNLVAQDQTLLTTVSSWDPMRVSVQHQ